MIDRIEGSVADAVRIWTDGGWAMWAIAVVAFVIFAMGLHTLFKLLGKGFFFVPEATWRRWLHHPAERAGPVGELLEGAASHGTIGGMSSFFAELRTTSTLPFTRDLRVMKICVGAAPLVGLLGTVTGMLATFDALASGTGGEKTMSKVAEGISEALITTETGLVIAIPGLFFQSLLARGFERYKAFLARLETACTQWLYRKTQAERADVATARIATATS